MNKSTLGFISIILAIIGLALGIGFLVSYISGGFASTLYLWLSILGWAILVLFGILAVLAFLKKDEQVTQNKGVLHDPKKPH